MWPKRKPKQSAFLRPVMLNRDEALVLYDVLFIRDVRGDSTEPQDDVEKFVVGSLTGALEVALKDELFVSDFDYEEELAAAKKRIAGE